MLPTRRIACGPFGVLREVDRALNQVWSDLEGQPTVGGFAVDIREVDDTLVVKADLPGFTKDQINLSVEQGVLTIEANRTDETKPEDKGETHLLERRAHHVVRRFNLPSTYNAEAIEATLTDGVLKLTLPKREEVKPRKIEVK